MDIEQEKWKEKEKQSWAQLEAFLKQQQGDAKLPEVQSFKDQYLKIISQKQCDAKLIEPFVDQLRNNRIFFDHQKFSKQVGIVKIYQSNYSKVIGLVVTFSYFKFQIYILNMEQKSASRESLKVFGKGMNGIIFLSEFDKQFFIIKHIPMQVNKNKTTSLLITQQIISRAIQEYCFYKLCSILKVGPYIGDFLGFDLIIYEDSVEFAMQLCKKSKTLDKKQEDSIKQSLGLLHSLNIIHGDIKPENIAWSPKYGKCVFLDFGYSRPVKQAIGEATKTTYFGTCMYSSPQFRSVLASRKSGMVDLFYNDAFGLQKTIEQMFSKQDQIFFLEFSLEFLISKAYINLLFNLHLLKLIFQQDTKSIKNYCQAHKNQEILEQNINFFMEMDKTKKNNNIFQFLKKQYHFAQARVEEIEKYFRKLGQVDKILEKKTEQKTVFSLRVAEKNLHMFESLNIVSDILISNYGQDIGYTARTVKEKLIIQLKSESFRPEKEESWRAFISYVENLYTNEEEILQIFEYVKDMLKIKDWPKCYHPCFCIALRANAIRDSLLSLHQIDLYKFDNLKQTINFFDNQKSSNSSYLKEEINNKIKKQYFKLKNKYQTDTYIKKSVGIKNIAEKILQKLKHYVIMRKCYLAYLCAMKQEQICRQGQLFQGLKQQKIVQAHEKFYNYCFKIKYSLYTFFSHELLWKVCMPPSIPNVSPQIFPLILEYAIKYTNLRQQHPLKFTILHQIDQILHYSQMCKIQNPELCQTIQLVSLIRSQLLLLIKMKYYILLQQIQFMPMTEQTKYYLDLSNGEPQAQLEEELAGKSYMEMYMGMGLSMGVDTAVHVHIQEMKQYIINRQYKVFEEKHFQICEPKEMQMGIRLGLMLKLLIRML